MRWNLVATTTSLRILRKEPAHFCDGGLEMALCFVALSRLSEEGKKITRKLGLGCNGWGRQVLNTKNCAREEVDINIQPFIVNRIQRRGSSGCAPSI
jgi:hypothetical protein